MKAAKRSPEHCKFIAELALKTYFERSPEEMAYLLAKKRIWGMTDPEGQERQYITDMRAMLAKANADLEKKQNGSSAIVYVAIFGVGTAAIAWLVCA